MNLTLQKLMREATLLTRSGRLSEATQALQRALGGLRGTTTSEPVRAPMPNLAPGLRPVRAPMPTLAPGFTRVGRGEFTSGIHSHASQTLAYRLYLPPGHAGRHLPLVVMLHGCTQNPDDFAAGTGMNERACEQGFVVLYPAQAKEVNPSRCWNWFQPGDQQRGQGEPALIAGMTRLVIEQHGIDPRRVYIAGLSAGGAMADIVAAAYPDVFAAVGIHSGLPRGSAANMVEALAAMKHGASGAGQRVAGQPVPAIVFHGDQDRTVHARNGEQVIAALVAGAGAESLRVEPGVSAQGRRFTRTIHMDRTGRSAAEHWVLHGAGHAWSGGHASGSYTDARGPDATQEMLRFFFEHPHALQH